MRSRVGPPLNRGERHKKPNRADSAGDQRVVVEQIGTEEQIEKPVQRVEVPRRIPSSRDAAEPEDTIMHQRENEPRPKPERKIVGHITANPA